MLVVCLDCILTSIGLYTYILLIWVLFKGQWAAIWCMKERLGCPHHHVLGHRVLRPECAKALSLLWLHQLIVLTLIHSICMQSAPETFIDSLNLTGKSLTRIISSIWISCGWRSPVSHLRLDFSSRRLWLTCRYARETRRLRRTSFGTSITM